MARRRVSFKAAPGVRISASSKGIRTSIGNSSARVSFGTGRTYTSAKIAGVRVSKQHSASRGRVGANTSRASIAQLERAQKAAALESQIAELKSIELALTTLHLESFPSAEPPRVGLPQPVDVEALSKERQREAIKGISVFRRTARKLARNAADVSAREEASRIAESRQRAFAQEQTAANEFWQRLVSHDPKTTIEVLDEAFADNASDATCVDAGVDELGRYATVIIMFAPVAAIPERTASVTPGGRPTT